MFRLPLSNPGIWPCIAATACTCVVCVWPQSLRPRPHFEVASVRPAANAEGRSLLQAVPGQLRLTNLTLRRLILIAYDAQDYQLSGGPSWIGSEHYDIRAKTDDETSVQQMEGPMLQSLLEERFRLSIHHETKQLSVFDLVIGKGGVKMQPSQESSCTPYSVDSPPPTAMQAGSLPNFCGLHLTVEGSNRTLEGKGVTMAALTASLSRTYNSFLGKNVIDGTGLVGTFDVHLTWSIDPLSASMGTDAAPLQDHSAPSLLTALQEQLGLKLESGRGPVEVLVIDHIEKLSAN